MTRTPVIFGQSQPAARRFGKADAAIIIGVVVLLYAGVRLALRAPAQVTGPVIALAPANLPLYAVFSLSRMLGAYALSLLFTLVYGYVAAYNHRAEQVLLPLLDVLQSVPILSFLPVVLLSLSAVLPEKLAVELAAVVLIFTSQAWNLTFAWYQSLTTIPNELREASNIFRFGLWMRLKTLELPFAANSLLWNSMMSWAGGWFFLMAAEIFTVGARDFRLPGLGAYLQEAAFQGNLSAIAWGLLTLVLVIVGLDQLVWRPLLAWANRFTLTMVESDNAPTSWFYDLVHSSNLSSLLAGLVRPLWSQVDGWLLRRFPMALESKPRQARPWALYGAAAVVALAMAYGGYRAGAMLVATPLRDWALIGLGLLATLLRVAVAVAIALCWTVPVGLAIGMNDRLARWLQPIVQILASVPATALFPVLLLYLTRLPGGLNVAAVLLMLMGTQWYLLFNVIAGANAIPQDLRYTASLLRFSRWQRWRTLFLPALFPYLVTGAITASGGAWNASIVAEHVEFGGRTLQTTGIGALIAGATASGDYHLLLAATATMILAVMVINRLVWRRLYRLAEERYRME
jgi:NitT/TauT family transport system permease protein